MTPAGPGAGFVLVQAHVALPGLEFRFDAPSGATHAGQGPRDVSWGALDRRYLPSAAWSYLFPGRRRLNAQSPGQINFGSAQPNRTVLTLSSLSSRGAQLTRSLDAGLRRNDGPNCVSPVTVSAILGARERVNCGGGVPLTGVSSGLYCRQSVKRDARQWQQGHGLMTLAGFRERCEQGRNIGRLYRCEHRQPGEALCRPER